MTLLLIRHGETPLNVARVLQPPDTPLSANGLAQAAALGRRLAAQPLAGVLSSDLTRALQTAQAIATACGAAVTTSGLLHERNFGDLRGLPYDTLDHDPIARDEAPPGGESSASFHARCALAWAWVLQQHARLGGPLAVVTHGLVLRRWLSDGTVLLPSGMAAPERLANTALTLVTAAWPHVAARVNCTRHLDADTGEDTASLSGG